MTSILSSLFVSACLAFNLLPFQRTILKYNVPLSQDQIKISYYSTFYASPSNILLALCHMLLAKPKYFKNLPGFNKITTSKIKTIHWGSNNTQNPVLSPQSVLIMPNFGQKRHNI
jgi:hypothetical protein